MRVGTKTRGTLWGTNPHETPSVPLSLRAREDDPTLPRQGAGGWPGAARTPDSRAWCARRRKASARDRCRQAGKTRPPKPTAGRVTGELNAAAPVSPARSGWLRL